MSTVLLLHCDGTNGGSAFPDGSASAHPVTAFGSAATSTAQSVFGGASLSLPSPGSYLSIPDSADLEFGSGDFTMEMRVYQTVWGAGSNTLLSKDNYLIGNGRGFHWYMQSTGYGLNLFTSDSALVSSSASHSFSLNTWYALAVSRVSGTVYFFVDGVMIGSSANAAAIQNTVSSVWIGADGNNSSPVYPSTGYFDEIRLSNTGLYNSNYGVASLPSGTTPTPVIAAISISGAAPSVIFGNHVAPTQGDITLTGLTPSATAGQHVAPTQGMMTVTGGQPGVSPVRVHPTQGAISITGLTPPVISGQVMYPVQGSVSLTGLVPYQKFTSNIHVTQPKASMGGFGGGTLNVAQPKSKLEVLADIGKGTTLSVTQPKASMGGFGGGTLNVVQPKARMAATAIMTITGRLSIAQPKAMPGASGLGGAAGSLAVMQPKAELVVNGGGTLRISQSKAMLSAGAGIGATGRLAVTQPVATFGGSGDFPLASMGVMTITQPAMRTNHGKLSVTQPAAVFLGSSAQAMATAIAYVMNTKTGETTTYSNFNFINIIRLGPEYYGVKADGLYRLGGDTDNGALIRASLTTAEDDFGVNNFKRVPTAYLDCESPTTITPIIDKKIMQPCPSSFGGHKTVLGKGCIGRHYQFRISNMAGSAMRIGSVELVVEAAKSRV